MSDPTRDALALATLVFFGVSFLAVGGAGIWQLWRHRSQLRTVLKTAWASATRRKGTRRPIPFPQPSTGKRRVM
jgi:hypothetical protein